MAKLVDPLRGLSKPRMVGICDRIFGLKTMKYKHPLSTNPNAIIPNANKAISPAKIAKIEILAILKGLFRFGAPLYHFNQLNRAILPAKVRMSMVNPRPAIAPKIQNIYIQ